MVIYRNTKSDLGIVLTDNMAVKLSLELLRLWKSLKRDFIAVAVFFSVETFGIFFKYAVADRNAICTDIDTVGAEDDLGKIFFLFSAKCAYGSFCLIVH